MSPAILPTIERPAVTITSVLGDNKSNNPQASNNNNNNNNNNGTGGIRQRPASSKRQSVSAGGRSKKVAAAKPGQQREEDFMESVTDQITAKSKRDIDGFKLWQTAKKRIQRYLRDRAIYQMVRRFIREHSCSVHIENGITMRHRAVTKDPIVQIVPRVLTVAATDPQVLSGGAFQPSQAYGSNVQRFLAIDRQGIVWTFDYDLQLLRPEYMKQHLPETYAESQHQSFQIYRTRLRIECDQFQLMELRPQVYCAASFENRAIRFYDARLELLLTFPVPHPVVKLQATVGDMVAVQSATQIDIFTIGIKALQTQTMVKLQPHLIIRPPLSQSQWILDFMICKQQPRIYVLTNTRMFVYRSDSGRLLESVDLSAIHLPRHATSLAYHERSSKSFVGYADGRVRVFDFAMNEMHIWRAHMHAIVQIKPHTNRQLFITLADENWLKVWHSETYHQVYEFEINGFGLFRDFSFIDDSALYWVSKSSISMCAVNFLGENVQRFTGIDRLSREKCHHSGVEGKIVLRSVEGTIRLLAQPRYMPQTVLLPTFDSESIVSITCSALRDLIYILFKGSIIQPYYTAENPCRTGELLNVLEICEEMVTRIAYYEKVYPNGARSYLLGSNDVGWLFILDDLGRVHNRIRVHEQPITQIIPWTDRDMIILTNADNSISVVRAIQDGDSLLGFENMYTLQPGIRCKQLAVGGKCVLLSSDEGTVEVVELEEKGRVNLPVHQQRENHLKSVTGAIYIRKIQLFVTSSLDGSLKLWDCSNQLIRTVSFSEPVTSVCGLNSYGDLLVAFRERLDMMPSQKYLPAGFVVMLSKVRQLKPHLSNRIKYNRSAGTAKNSNRSALVSRSGVTGPENQVDKRKINVTFLADSRPQTAGSALAALPPPDASPISKVTKNGFTASLEQLIFRKVKLEMTAELDRNLRHEYSIIHTEERAKLLKPQITEATPTLSLEQNSAPLKPQDYEKQPLKLPVLSSHRIVELPPAETEAETFPPKQPPASAVAISTKNEPIRKPRKKLVLPKGAFLPNSCQKVLRTSIAGKLVNIRIRKQLEKPNVTDSAKDCKNASEDGASNVDAGGVALEKAIPAATFKQRLQALVLLPLTRQEDKRKAEEEAKAAAAAAAAELEEQKKRANALKRKPPPRPKTPEFMRIRRLDDRERRLDCDSDEIDFDLLLQDDNLEHQWLKYFRNCTEMQVRTDVMLELYTKYQNGELEDSELALAVFCDFIRYICPVRSSKPWSTFVETVLEGFAYFTTINENNFHALVLQLASLKDAVYKKAIAVLVYLGFTAKHIDLIAKKVYFATHIPSDTERLFNFTERSQRRSVKAMLKTLIIVRNEEEIDVYDVGYRLPRVSSQPSLPEILRSQSYLSVNSSSKLKRSSSLTFISGSKDYHRNLIRKLRERKNRTDFTVDHQRFEELLEVVSSNMEHKFVEESGSQSSYPSSATHSSLMEPLRSRSRQSCGSRESKSYSSSGSFGSAHHSGILDEFRSVESFFSETANDNVRINNVSQKQSRPVSTTDQGFADISVPTDDAIALPVAHSTSGRTGNDVSNDLSNIAASKIEVQQTSVKDELLPKTSADGDDRSSSSRQSLPPNYSASSRVSSESKNRQPDNEPRTKSRSSSGVRFADSVPEKTAQALADNTRATIDQTTDLTAFSTPKSARKPVSARPQLPSVSESQAQQADSAAAATTTAGKESAPVKFKSPFSSPLPKTPASAKQTPPFTPTTTHPSAPPKLTTPVLTLSDIQQKLNTTSKPPSATTAPPPSLVKLPSSPAFQSKPIKQEPAGFNKTEKAAEKQPAPDSTRDYRPAVFANFPAQKSPSINEGKPNIYAKFAELDPNSPIPPLSLTSPPAKKPDLINSSEPIVQSAKNAVSQKSIMARASSYNLDMDQNGAIDQTASSYVEAAEYVKRERKNHKLAKSISNLSTRIYYDSELFRPRFPSDSIIYEPPTPVMSRAQSLREVDSQGSMIMYIKQRKIELEEELELMKTTAQQHAMTQKIKKVPPKPKIYWVGQLKPRVDTRGKFISMPRIKDMEPIMPAAQDSNPVKTKTANGESDELPQPRLKRRPTGAPTIIPAVFNEQALPVPVTRSFMPTVEYFEIGPLPESSTASNLVAK